LTPTRVAHVGLKCGLPSPDPKRGKRKIKGKKRKNGKRLIK